MTRGTTRTFLRGLTALLLTLSTLFPALAQDEAIVGIWRTPTGSEVTIEPCGDGFCGRVTKAVIPPNIRAQYSDEKIAEYEKSLTDALNKDPDLRDRPIINLQILSLDGGNASGRYSGRVYNPEDGNTYDGHVQMTARNRLDLSGCVLLILCQTQEWRRVRD